MSDGSTSPPTPLSSAERGSRRLVGLLWTWGPVLVWMAFILSLSSQSDLRSAAPTPVVESQSVFFAVSKLVHVVEYGVLGLLLLRAVTSDAGGLTFAVSTAVLASVLVAGLFGAMDELRQSFVPNRTPRLADIALDTGAALVATLLAAAVLRLRRGRPPMRRAATEQARP